VKSNIRKDPRRKKKPEDDKAAVGYIPRQPQVRFFRFYILKPVSYAQQSRPAFRRTTGLFEASRGRHPPQKVMKVKENFE